jgi:hypothetical protein
LSIKCAMLMLSGEDHLLIDVFILLKHLHYGGSVQGHKAVSRLAAVRPSRPVCIVVPAVYSGTQCCTYHFIADGRTDTYSSPLHAVSHYIL